MTGAHLNSSLQSVVRRPQRWDEPLSNDMSQSSVKLVLESIHFRMMSADNFAPQISLNDIVRNDCKIHVFESAELMIRSGAYLNSMFVVLSGQACTYRQKVDGQNLKVPSSPLKPRAKPSVVASLIKWLKKPRSAEVRNAIDALSVDIEDNSRISSKSSSKKQAKLSSYGRVKKIPDTARELVAGDVFGESAVLGRNEMEYSVVAKSSCTVLEIRWQGLRELRKREAGFREFVDGEYRQRGLYDYLCSIPLFKSLPKSSIRELAEQALFEIHGEFEWHRKFKKASKKVREEQDFDHVIESEVLIASEGDYQDGVLLVRNGFARLSRKVNHGHYTIGHLSAGDFFGLEELSSSNEQKKNIALNCSLRALGYTDVIRIPTIWLEKHLLGNSDEKVQATLSSYLESSRVASESPASRSAKPIDQKLTEFVIEHHFINGTEAMMIDLERCVRCDDCVTACANAHDNNPRFNRHGPRSGRYMIANACMHCEDPVCMIGCPTGAIHRAQDGVVSINDATCIGCSTCANSCPYDNITMVGIRDEQGQVLVDSASKPILKATKCDLCSTVAGGPACERACSHDALVRIDLKDSLTLADWLDR